MKKKVFPVICVLFVLFLVLIYPKIYLFPTLVTVNGRVIDNSKGCDIDLDCTLKIKDGAIIYSFTYGEGLRFDKKTGKIIQADNCLTDDEMSLVWKLEPDENIEIKAWIRKDNLFYKKIGTCPKGSSSLKITK